MTETTVYLIRHSEATPKNNIKNISNKDDHQIMNEKNILSVSGEKRAEELSKSDELQMIDSVYSSSYVRALETAKYIALENDTIINIDDRLNERKIGIMKEMDWKKFQKLQTQDFDFKLPEGESLNQTKKRMVDAMKSILMFEVGNRVAIISHSTALSCLLSSWCEVGYNYENEILLSFKGETIVDGTWTAPHVLKVTFEGMNPTNIEYLNIV